MQLKRNLSENSSGFLLTHQSHCENYLLAHANILRLKAGFDSPVMSDFVSKLDYLNGLAEKSSGFVWRSNSDTTDLEETFSVFQDRYVVLNMSVWASVDDLKNFVISPGHMEMMTQRNRWVQESEYPTTAMWWIRENARPTARTSKAALQTLAKHGPSIEAFTFAQVFPKPETLV